MGIDGKFMKVALAEARIGMRQHQKPFAACLVRDGKVIAKGHNTVHLDKDVAAHGEVNALRNACRKIGSVHLYHSFKGSTMYTTCEPCPMCLGACEWAGVRRVVYGISLKDLVNIDSGKTPRGKKQISYNKGKMKFLGGVLRTECVGLFLGYKD